jgi:uncharacterized RDD family membrane protein YckC
MGAAEEPLPRARRELEAGRDEEALEALQLALREAKETSQTDDLQEVASLAQTLRSRTSGRLSEEAGHIEYAASQNVRRVERSAALGLESALPVEEDYLLASWIRRVLAFSFDMLVVVGILYVLPLACLWYGFEAGGSDFQETSAGGLAVFFALIGLPVLWPVYFALFHGLGSGQTPGKRALGLGVRNVRGAPLGLGRAFGRGYFMLLIYYLFPFTFLLDNLWPLWDKRNQALHDKIVNSVVVRAP